ncbi:metal-dependent hydrolase [Halocatena halophila]|uniref:metal-dependent hydrolase n=1 Tax=Halocatena halophila TaxID=2814576 RepID=UPI002ED176C5
MDRHGHVGINLLVFTPVACYLLIENQPLLIVMGFIGLMAIEPMVDIDQYLPGMSHGGTSHSLFAVGIVGLLSAVCVYVFTGFAVTSITQAAFGQPLLLGGAVEDSPLNPMYNARHAFFIGAGAVCSHLLGDFLSESGIRPLMPFLSQKVSYPVIRLTGWGQYLLVFAGVVSLAAGMLVFS